ncbi:hypothetical protein G7Y89_g4499 [Cudoniella acicularis]|uniref:Serine hydrolase domain-containing protein n=1 Tax=Cudoniella acicularis TaxID=354080 RepID=A0A8H4W6M9_9HELO|nr:hypothetical protein G7Y89_g4499 [Cudoniella acicularis]
MTSPFLSHSTDTNLPRLLCLHGGGVTAQVFRLQCRSLIKALSPYFRLVFADGPFVCAAGPGISPVYAGYGPYRRWLRWLPEHPEVGDRDAAAAIEKCIRMAMEADDVAGGRGEWVGLLGFSQGGKVAASMLFEAQTRQDNIRRSRWRGGFEEGDGGDVTTAAAEYAGGKWRFAILLASRAPLVALSDLTYNQETLDMPGSLCASPVTGELSRNRHRLRIPTVHVHGLRDPGLKFHRALFCDFTALGSAEVVEWDGDHRVPIKTKDVDRVVQATLNVAIKAGLRNVSQI